MIRQPTACRPTLPFATYVSTSTVNRFLTRDRFQHYLGWQYPAGMPEGTFAHSGFTGTWVVGVPKHKLSIVLLTNRQQLGTDARGYFPMSRHFARRSPGRSSTQSSRVNERGPAK